MFSEIVFLLCLMLFSIPVLAVLGGGFSLLVLKTHTARPVSAPALRRSSLEWHKDLNSRLNAARTAEVYRIEVAEKSLRSSLVFRGWHDSTRIRCFIDTGADTCLVAKSLIPPSEIRDSHVKITGLSGAEIPCHGTTSLRVRFGTRTFPISALVVDDDHVPKSRSVLLGENWLEKYDPTIRFSKRSMHFGDPRRSVNAISIASELKHTTTGDVPQAFLDKFVRLFSEPTSLPPSRPGLDVKLKVTGTPPPSREIRIKDPTSLKHIDDCVSTYQKRGFIEHRPTPEVNPCSAFTVKSGGTDGTGAAKLRMVFDFVKLNEVTDVLPSNLPRIGDLLRQVCKSKFFSKIDLRDGFYNLRMHPDSIEKTATLFPGRGIYVWKVLPMGLADGPGRFQAAMRQELADFVATGRVVIYLDDILIHAATQAEHDTTLLQILERLEQRDYHLKPSKCALNVTTVDFLGHRIEDGCFKPQVSNVQGILEFPFPATIQQWQRFHGMANFYRLHVPRFSDIMKPIASILGISQRELDGSLPIPKESRARLVQMLRAKDDCLVTSFKALKKALADACPLTETDPLRTLYCITDASKAAWGSVITHDPTGKEAPIAWLSGTFSASEKGWHSIDREIFALVASIRRYPEYFGGPVTVLTDSAHLVRWSNLDITSERLARWSETLGNCRLTLTHLPGKDNIVADALSRSVDKMNDDWAGKVIPPKMIASLLSVPISGPRPATCAPPPPTSDRSKTIADQEKPSVDVAPTAPNTISRDPVQSASPPDVHDLVTPAKLKAPTSPEKPLPVPPKTSPTPLFLSRSSPPRQLPQWSQAHQDAMRNNALELRQAFDDRRMIDVAEPGSAFHRNPSPVLSKVTKTLGCPKGCKKHFTCINVPKKMCSAEPGCCYCPEWEVSIPFKNQCARSPANILAMHELEHGPLLQV